MLLNNTIVSRFLPRSKIPDKAKQTQRCERGFPFGTYFVLLLVSPAFMWTTKSYLSRSFFSSSPSVCLSLCVRVCSDPPPPLSSKLPRGWPATYPGCVSVSSLSLLSLEVEPIGYVCWSLTAHRVYSGRCQLLARGLMDPRLLPSHTGTHMPQRKSARVQNKVQQQQYKVQL